MSTSAMSDEEEARDFAASGRQVDRETKRRGREQDRASADAYRQGRTEASTSRRVPKPKGDTQRRIVGSLAFAVLFALLGYELEHTKAGPSGIPNVASTPGGPVTVSTTIPAPATPVKT